MVGVSDNVAADVLLEILTKDAINERLTRIGLSRTRVTTPLSDTNALADWCANPTTAMEQCQLLGAVYRREIPRSELFLDTLGLQQHRHRIPSLLPRRARVYNKTGTLVARDGNVLVHDVGIVKGGRCDFAMAFLSQNQESVGSTGIVCGAIALAAYGLLNGTEMQSPAASAGQAIEQVVRELRR